MDRGWKSHITTRILFEIITNEIYIAKIKINFNKDKIINLFRNNNIKYTDIKSKPFLIITSYNIRTL